MNTVPSGDGTPIAFDRSGEGSPIILVGGALQYRSIDPRTAPLAALLAEHFTVFHYDRRGRGDSGDTAPYAVEREIEDLDALINEAGGSAFVFAMSSGGALALEAAAHGLAITKLALYEPPFIVDDIGMGPPSPSTMPAPDEWIRRLGTLPLMHQPGERWMYNTGSDVLGVLIARASGRPFGTFLRERIFEPLGMSDTAFSVPAAKLDRLATSYWTNPATGALGPFDEAEGGQWSRPPAFPSGAGGLVSTVDDYSAFGQMMLSKGRLGGVRVLSRPSVELMTADHLTPEQKAVSGLVPGSFDSHGWGFGVSVITRRDDVARSVGTFGWDGGLGTSWFADPREDLVTILMTQRAWTSPKPPDVCLDFWTSAYQAIDD